MSWYKTALSRLAAGKKVVIVNRGASLRGLVEDGQLVIVEPVITRSVCIGEIVLARIRKGRFVMHLVKDIKDSLRYLIGNNIGGLDGWVSVDAVYGRICKILNEPSDFAGLTIDEYDI